MVDTATGEAALDLLAGTKLKRRYRYPLAGRTTGWEVARVDAQESPTPIIYPGASRLKT